MWLVRKADNSLCLVMKSGNLIFLEPSGPLEACNGTALPAFEGPRQRANGNSKTLLKDMCY